jgi:cardiolipin synthase A/B
MSSFELLETREYYARLLEAVSRSKKYVNITSYDLIYDEVTKELLDELVSAAERGVKVVVSTDTMSLNEMRGRDFGPINPLHPSASAAKDYAARLRRAGGTFAWLGKMLVVNSYIQRNHEKWSVVDDHVFCFGGINLYRVGFANIDYMLYTENADLAEVVREQHQSIIATHPNYTGFSFEIDQHNTLHIDGAQRNSSHIYERACRLAQGAKKVVFVSQFYPTGELAKHLRASDTTYYANQPKNMSSLLVRSMQTIDAWRTGIKNSYTRDQYLHAKCLIFTMPDDTKVALTGSHNFSYAGVRFGTIESNLETRDQATITQLEAFIKKYIG